ncbi:MAG: amidohydrolase family protein [Saprospiraceae bacterium]
MRKFTFVLAFFLFTASWANAQSKTYEVRNGSWFNGQGFDETTWYINNGILTKKAPAQIDSVIDLSGRWVIPPQGDAFCSSVAGNPSAEYTLDSYFGEGIFYLQVLSNNQEGREALKGQTNTATSPDIAFANGGLTCQLGIPFVQFEGPANKIRNPREMADKYNTLKTSRKMLGDGYWFLDNKDDVNKNWDKIMAQKPEILSIYLLDVKNNGGKEGYGLSEEVAKQIIKKAKKSKTPVYAHVQTAEDVRLAIKLKVNGIANLPGAMGFKPEDKDKYELTTDDMKKLAKKNTPVVPLLSKAQANGANPDLQKKQAEMLSTLISNDVNVVIGSDDPQRTIRSELNYWFQLGGLDYTKVLKILCENTPQAVFPNRKIGKIAEGYEASFVVLNDNPTRNLLKIRAVSFMVKNGKVIVPETK